MKIKKLQLKSNERLEFLGDAVLELIITEYLFERFPNEDEGTLSLKRSSLVNEVSLAKLARNLRLQNFIIIGRGEIRGRGNHRDSVLSDVLEALFGAIYLDGGYKVAKNFILSSFENLLLEIGDIEKKYNFKNQLQEYAQSKYKTLPQYRLIKRSGPEHRQSFKVSVYLNNKFMTLGTGSSVKKAEQTASKNALNLINRHKESC